MTLEKQLKVYKQHYSREFDGMMEAIKELMNDTVSANDEDILF